MIVLISCVFPPEPVISATLSYDLAVELSKKNKVTVLFPRPTRPKGYSFNPVCETNALFSKVQLRSFAYPNSKLIGRILESYSFGRHSIRYIRKNKGDISSIYMNSWPLISQFLIVRLARKLQIPIVVHVQDIYPESFFKGGTALNRIFNKLIIPIDRFVLTRAKHVIAISRSMEEYLISSRSIKRNSISVIHNWSNEIRQDFNSSFSIKSRIKPQLLYMFLGSLSPTAALDKLIESFGLYGVRDSNLILAGSGSEKYLLQSVVKRCKYERIQFIDAPADKAMEILSHADVLVLSLRKGAAKFAMPSKLTSYMLSRKPILAIVDDGSDTSIAIKTADCGWVVSPDDLTELREQFERISNISIEEKRRLGENGYKYAIENFSKKKNLKLLSDSILNVIY